MSNSSLVSYTKISPHRRERKHKIDTVSVHCMAGNLSVESCGAVFSNKNNIASSNYGIGSDGRIALYVPEDERSICTSSIANDDRAVTIEVANDSGAPDWHVSHEAMQSLIKLLADICKRNGIKELKWNIASVSEASKKFNELRNKGYSFDNAATIAYKNLKENPSVQNMTVHRWFSQKACPGEYLMEMHPYIASEVNKLLKAKNDSTGKYKVLKNRNIRKGASSKSASVGICTAGIYTITEVKKNSAGNVWGKLKSGIGWINLSTKKDSYAIKLDN